MNTHLSTMIPTSLTCNAALSQPPLLLPLPLSKANVLAPYLPISQLPHPLLTSPPLLPDLVPTVGLSLNSLDSGLLLVGSALILYTLCNKLAMC